MKLNLHRVADVGPAFLTIQSCRPPKTIRFSPRHSRLLQILCDARNEDSRPNLPAAARGWRSRSLLAQQLKLITQYEVEPSTITAYATELCRSTRKWLGTCLIQRARGLGMRLNPAVELSLEYDAASAEACDGESRWHD